MGTSRFNVIPDINFSLFKGHIALVPFMRWRVSAQLQLLGGHKFQAFIGVEDDDLRLSHQLFRLAARARPPSGGLGSLKAFLDRVWQGLSTPTPGSLQPFAPAVRIKRRPPS